MHIPCSAAQEYGEAARLMQSLDRLRRTWEHILHDAPVRRGEIMLIGCLMEQEDHGGDVLTIGDLARRLHQSPPAITQKVNALEEEGLLRRTVNESDRRMAWVELTGKGRTMAQKAMRAYWKRLEQALAKMGKRDAEEMLRLMNRLCEVLEEDR